MITTTSAEAAKLLRTLKENYQAAILKEEKLREFRASVGEDPESVRPEYDYESFRDELALTEAKIRRLKHAINVFNTTHTVPEFGMTVDEMLVWLPQITARKNKLAGMISKLPKERVESHFGRMTNVIDYNYLNYDLAKAKEDYDRTCEELARAQLALDRVNTADTFEIDVD